MIDQKKVVEETKNVFTILLVLQGLIIGLVAYLILISGIAFIGANIFGSGVKISEHVTWLWQYGLSGLIVSIIPMVFFGRLFRSFRVGTKSRMPSEVLVIAAAGLQFVVFLVMYFLNMPQKGGIYLLGEPIPERSFFQDFGEQYLWLAILAFITFVVGMNVLTRLKQRL